MPLGCVQARQELAIVSMCLSATQGELKQDNKDHA